MNENCEYKKIIYLDNAATTWIKPPIIIKKVNSYFNEFWGSPKRTYCGDDIIEDIRATVSRFIDCPHVVFTSGATFGMNVVINSLKCGEHVITTNCEHHCVYRPLHHLKIKYGIEYDIVDYIDSYSQINPDSIFSKIKNNTKMVIMTHASNVTGAIFDVENIGRELKNRRITFIVDASQTAGIVDVSLKTLNANIVVFSAHKHLYGLPGLGILGFDGTFDLCPVIFGGTGKKSSLMYQPTELPEFLETGTPNIPAILSLQASMEYIEKNMAINNKHENELSNYFLSEIKKVTKMKLYMLESKKRTSTFSMNHSDFNPTLVVAPYLLKNNIIIREGLHCSPLIHKALGTYPQGSIRVSFSAFTEKNDIDKFLNYIDAL